MKNLITAVLLSTLVGCVSPTSATDPQGEIDLGVDAGPAPDWTLIVPRFAESVEPGGTASYSISLTANSTFSGTIEMSSSGTPRHSTPVFTPSSYTLTPNEGALGTFKIETTTRTPAGTYDVTVISQSGTIENDGIVVLVVQ